MMTQHDVQRWFEQSIEAMMRKRGYSNTQAKTTARHAWEEAKGRLPNHDAWWETHTTDEFGQHIFEKMTPKEYTQVTSHHACTRAVHGSCAVCERIYVGGYEQC